MFLVPCNRCPKRHPGCARNLEIRAGVRGLKLGSIKFRCDEHIAQFQPGMRVQIRFGRGLDEFLATGTVMAWSDRKVQVCVDAEFVSDLKWNGVDDCYQPEGTVKHAVVKIWPDRLDVRNQDPLMVPICRNCRKPMGREIEGWKCDKNEPIIECVAGDPVSYWRELSQEAADAWNERNMA